MGDTLAVDLDGHFRDRDGDDLSYTASSSAPAVATVAVDGSELKVAGVARGETTVTVEAADGHGGETSGTFAVMVPNQAPAAIAIDPLELHKSQADTVNAAAHFSDPDGDDLTYEAVSSDVTVATVTVTDSLVVIEGVSPGGATVAVEADDGRGGTAEQTIAVTVANRAPAFPAGAIERAVRENAGRGRVVGEPVTATDPDGQTVGYAFVPGADEASFDIHAQSGQITVARRARLDYEADSLHTVLLEATDGELADTAEVTIRLIDQAVPGVPASLDLKPWRLGVHLTWTPPEEGAEEIVGYTIRQRRSGGVPSLTRVGNVLTATIEFPNPEALYGFEVRARNAEGAGAWTTGVWSRVNRPPAFPADTLERTVAENAAAGTEVGEPVTAADAIRDTLTYAFVPGHDEALFDIHADSARITVAEGAALDYEADSLHTVLVEATDGELADTATVTIRLTDLAGPGRPPPPVVTPWQLGVRLAWEPPEGEVEISGYDLRLREEGSPAWTEQAQGDTLAATVELPSLTALYEFQVRALNADDAGPWSETAEGRASRAPAFPADTLERAVAENAPAGTAVGEPVTAVSTDPAAELSYALLTGADEALFDIHADSARITVAEGAMLDYEADSLHTVLVEATDGEVADTATVIIRVTDVPRPGAPTPPAVTGWRLGVDVAWEPPQGAVGITEYELRLREVGATSWRAVRPTFTTTSTRAVPVVTAICLSVYEVQVRARSAEGPGPWSESGRGRAERAARRRWTRSTSLALHVLARPTRVNANALLSRDPNGDTLTYAVSSSDSAVAGVSVSDSLIVVEGVSPGEATVTVTADDGWGGSASHAFTVTVTGRGPEFPAGGFERTVAEDAPPGTPVGLPVEASHHEPAIAVRYALVPGSDAAHFEIHPGTGQITLAEGAALDFESAPLLTVAVEATDGRLADTATVTIVVTDADDPGTVALDAAVARTGVPITATLADQDGVTGPSVPGWERSATTAGRGRPCRSPTGPPTRPQRTTSARCCAPPFAYGDPYGTNKTAVSAASGSQARTCRPRSPPRRWSAPSPRTPRPATPVGGPVAAHDANDDSLAYSLAPGAAGAPFAIDDATGQIAVAEDATLDYEGGDTLYVVEVEATDGTLAASATVTIRVTDADDPGAVTLDAAVARVGSPLTATLEEPDGATDATVRWRWQRQTPGGLWTDVGTATNTYTPEDADAGSQLRVRVVYDDRFGPGKSAMGGPVRVTDENVAPAFDPPELERTVAENAAPGTAVGEPVTAEDANMDSLAYRILLPPDRELPVFFAIDEATGQIVVAEGAGLDYERGDIFHTFLVEAADGMLADTAIVTIRVTDADDPAVVTLDAGVARVGTPVAATMADPDGVINRRVRWQHRAAGHDWTDVPAATDTAYTPAPAEAGGELRAVFTYDDDFGTDKEAASDALRVTDENAAPEFPAPTLERTVAENAAPGAPVGEPVTAADANLDPLSYRFLFGPGVVAVPFEIGETTGQITVGSGAGLDFEGGTTAYTVDVEASDRMYADTATVTIRVTDADDPAVVTLDAGIARTGTALSAELHDPDGVISTSIERSWELWTPGTAAWNAIAGAVGSSYTPVPAEEGMRLRAAFIYADRHGPGRRAFSAEVNVVGAETPAVSFGAATYRAAPDASAAVDVLLSHAPDPDLDIPVSITTNGRTTGRTVTIGRGQTAATLDVGTAHLAPGDTIALRFGTLPAGIATALPDVARIAVTSDVGSRARARSRPAHRRLRRARLHRRRRWGRHPGGRARGTGRRGRTHRAAHACRHDRRCRLHTPHRRAGDAHVRARRLDRHLHRRRPPGRARRPVRHRLRRPARRRHRRRHRLNRRPRHRRRRRRPVRRVAQRRTRRLRTRRRRGRATRPPRTHDGRHEARRGREGGERRRLRLPVEARRHGTRLPRRTAHLDRPARKGRRPGRSTPDRTARRT